MSRFNDKRRVTGFLEHALAGELVDPRIDRHKEHKRIDILVIAICAIWCGANDWVAVETFGQAKREWFTRFLDLAHGIPSHDTFGRVFAVLSPEALQACFPHWIQAVAQVTEGQVVAIDGKTLRHIAPNLLRQDSRAKLGIHNKRLKAGWDDAYLANPVFGHAF